MTIADTVLIVALAVFVAAWWARARRAVLFGAAAVALAAGLYGVFDDRWQAGAGVVAAVVLLLALLVSWLRRAPRRGVPVWSGLLLGAVAIVGVAPLYLFPVNDLPAPSGPQAVGVRGFELVDDRRRGVFAAADEPRRLLVRVWYPAAPVTGRSPRSYFNAVEATSTARSMGELFRFPPFLTYLKHARTHSYEDAPLLAGASALPTVIYSHGYTSFASQNTALMEELASHGYVVYSVQHTFDASATVFPNGDIAPIDPALVEQMKNSPEAKGELPESMVKGLAGATFDERLEGQLQHREQTLAAGERITTSARVWLADRLFVHDRLQQGEVPALVADIVAASRLDRVGEVGMSFGGSTTGAVCVVDPRCAAGVNLDGSDFHSTPLNADMPQPFLMFYADFDAFYQRLGVVPGAISHGFNDFSYERFDRSGEREDIHRLQLKGTLHLGLSDFSWFMRRPARDALLGTAPAEVMLGAQNDFVRGFFDKYLRGFDNGFPAPQYEKYRPWAEPYDNGTLRVWWQSLSEPQRAAFEGRIEALREDAVAH